jgi:hypothetical protein
MVKIFKHKKPYVRRGRRVGSHSQRYVRKGMGWVPRGRGKEVFFIEKPEDYDEFTDIMFHRLAGSDPADTEKKYLELQMAAHPVGSRERGAFEEVLRKKYNTEYSAPMVISRPVAFRVNPAFESAKVEGVSKQGIAEAVVVRRRKKLFL